MDYIHTISVARPEHSFRTHYAPITHYQYHFYFHNALPRLHCKFLLASLLANTTTLKSVLFKLVIFPQISSTLPHCKNVAKGNSLENPLKGKSDQDWSEMTRTD